MAKKVIGVYDNEYEVMDAVNQLERAGYTPEEITLIAKRRDDTAWFREETDVETETSIDLSTNRSEDLSFWEKVKYFFVRDLDYYDRTGGFTSRFNEYGLSEDEALRYNAEVQEGKIVMLVPEPSNPERNRQDVMDEFNWDEAYRNERARYPRELDAAYLEDEERRDKKSRRSRKQWPYDNDPF